MYPTGCGRKRFHRQCVVLAGCFLVLLAMITPLGSAQSTASTPQRTDIERTHDATQALLALYNPNKGLFETMGWWNSANAITTLADESRIDPAIDAAPVFSNTFKQAQVHSAGFINKFYDDEGWWALAWIDVYERQGDEAYLRMAQSIFSDMTGGWDNVCGGGIWWNKDRHYKNAIANELFLSVAAKLAQHSTGSKQQEYLKWANREWTWFSASGMINDRGLINDGLDDKCRNNKAATWSYNQGVILAGLADLSAAKPDKNLLDPANRIALAAIEHLTDSAGILHDPCEPGCKRSGDGVQFKGIFVRDLLELYRRSPDPRYAVFLRTNADAVWNHARSMDNHFGASWSGPPGGDYGRDFGGALGSALDALVSGASLDRP